MCGIGVVSLIDKILNPLDWRERKAVSRPEPGPLTWTVSVLNPCSKAFAPASSAATCAAYGVDFLDPLKPLAPAEDQDTTLPLSSAIDIIVLLNVE